MVVSLRSAQPCVGLHFASALAVVGASDSPELLSLNQQQRDRVKASGGPEQVTLPTRATQ
jgi:hypothetical protein